MEDFKYLGNEPGLQTFPLMDNLDVQKTQTSFNWNLWNKNTKLYMRHVPANWSSDYEHVVRFDSEEARREYLHAGNPTVLETEFRLNNDGTIRLPIPYDNVINYNYITAVYPDAPVPRYNHNTARQEYYYFIEDAVFIAPNTTELRLELDIWTTYIDDIDVKAMLLERGHLPMTYSNVDDYLENPLNNCLGLLTEDVKFGNLAKINKDNEWNLYSDATYYVVATTANPKIFIKETTTHNGGQAYKYSDNLFYFGVYETDWPTFCTNIMTTCPAFLQTIQGIIAIPVSMIASASSPFTFGGVSCYEVFTWNLSMEYDLSTEDFGYDSEYEWITKLYTYPYAAIEVIDWHGETKLIKIEELYTGSVILQNMGNLNIVNPTQTIVMLDVNGDTTSQKINWHINFPHTGANINPLLKYMFETEYPRLQRTNEINLDKAVKDEQLDNSYDITELENSYSEEVTALNSYYNREKTRMDLVNAYADAYLNDVNNIANAAHGTGGTVVNALATLAATAAAGGIGLGAIGISNAMDKIGVGADASISSYNFGQSMVSGATGEMANSINGAIGAINSGADVQAAMMAQEILKQKLNNHFKYVSKLNGTHGQAGIDSTQISFFDDAGFIGWISSIISGSDATVDFPMGSFSYEEGLFNQQAKNLNDKKVNLTKTVANKNKVLGKSINNRNKNMALAAITNAINQSKMNNNVTYGGNSDTSLFEAGKMKMKYHVIRLNDDNVKKTGDYFLRYGYAYDGWVDFDNNWKVMSKFTFWKVREVMFNCNQINNKVIKLFKAILERGVTVWNSPSDLNDSDVLYNNTIYQPPV